jgi:hypothetical protein
MKLARKPQFLTIPNNFLTIFYCGFFFFLLQMAQFQANASDLFAYSLHSQADKSACGNDFIFTKLFIIKYLMFFIFAGTLKITGF